VKEEKVERERVGVEAVILIKSSLRVGLIDLSSQMFVCHELSIFHPEPKSFSQG